MGLNMIDSIAGAGAGNNVDLSPQYIIWWGAASNRLLAYPFNVSTGFGTKYTDASGSLSDNTNQHSVLVKKGDNIIVGNYNSDGLYSFPFD